MREKSHSVDRHHFRSFTIGKRHKNVQILSQETRKTFEIMICSLLRATTEKFQSVGRSVGFVSSAHYLCSFHSNPSRHLTKIKCLFITLLTCVCLHRAGEIVHKHLPNGVQTRSSYSII